MMRSERSLYRKWADAERKKVGGFLVFLLRSTRSLPFRALIGRGLDRWETSIIL